jgi:UDP-N-acetylmuramoyl-tripeptide--D-alanyl-D-alanine ligase
VPLRGERFDGHDFLIQAARRGAAACLVEEVVSGFPVPVVRVGDTLSALGDLAQGLRREFAGPVVAVTGSSGKTTTKEMLAAILAQTARGLKSEGNFNNLIGLPLTLCRLAAEDHWAVLEMGMSARGEIARLAEIAEPTVGIITNVGPAHLESLHGLEGVARAKGELFAALKAGTVAVVNADDEKVAGIPIANGVRRLSFGSSPTAEVRAEGVCVSNGGVTFRLVLPAGTWPVRLALPGRHNVANALAAAAAAVALEVSPENIVRGLEGCRNCPNRMELIRLGEGSVLLEDSYNANPLSVRAALQALDELGGGGRRIAVLGDMLELGAEAASHHREIGTEAARRSDLLLLLGDWAKETAAGAFSAGMPPERVAVTASHEEAVARLRAWLHAGDRILVKGSRGMRMERVSGALRENEARLAANHS